MAYTQRYLKRRLVRCLGFGPEHTFVSPDPLRVRRCGQCEEKLREMRLGQRAEVPPVQTRET